MNMKKKPNKMYGYIYKITCKVNGRCYVGQHRKSVFDDAYWGSSKNPEFKSDFKQYGKENFNREILYWATTQSELNEKEMDFIISENALTSNGGYNLWLNRSQIEWTSEAKEKFLAIVNSPEYKEKQRIASSNRKVSLETRKKISESIKNSKKHKEAIKKITSDPNYRKHMSEVIKNSEKHKKWYTDPELRKIRFENPEYRKKVSRRTSESQIGKHWYNNGIFNVFRFECPEGFKSGRIYKRKSCIKDNLE